MIFLALAISALLILMASFVLYTKDRWGDDSISVVFVMLLPIALTVSILLLSGGEVFAGSLVFWVAASSLAIMFSALRR